MTEAKKSLVEELDKDLEDFLKQKIEESKNKPRPFNFDNKTVDEIAEEMKQHPVFMTEFDETKPLSQAAEALQVLKYQSDDNDENALSYKEDGNKNFGRKKYRWAIDNYTAGINCKPTDTNLTCILYTNRAAAHYHIGNYRSSILDCIEALKHNPSHKKAWNRVIQSNVKLEKHQEVIQWCDRALSKHPEDSDVLEWRKDAMMLVKKKERDDRKKKQEMKKKKESKMALVDAIKKRGIRFNVRGYREALRDDDDVGVVDDDDVWVMMLSQEIHNATVQLNQDSSMQWPVTFFYPEHSNSDFIQAFHESSTFKEHMKVMFQTPPKWDLQRLYTPHNLNIYYEERLSSGLSHFHPIPLHSTLLDVLTSPSFVLLTSSLTFFIFVKNSPGEEIFLRENCSGSNVVHK